MRRGVPLPRGVQGGRVARRARGPRGRRAPRDRAPPAPVEIHPALDAQALLALDPAAAVAAKESLGGTGPGSRRRAQLAWLRDRAVALAAKASEHGSLEDLARRVFAEPLERA